MGKVVGELISKVQWCVLNVYVYLGVWYEYVCV